MMKRAVGIALLGGTWLFWTFVAFGDTIHVDACGNGFPPHVVLVAYGMFGLMLAIPLLLPQAIARPRHVASGPVKATILVAAAFALIDSIRVAIGLHVPDPYEATVLAIVPVLFRSIAGIAVMSVLLVAFFR